MEPNHLAENLRFLCGHYRSVAEVCRLIGVNRQQFNKYLSGASQPSMRNLRRICEFFGVEETEILLRPGSLAPLVRVRTGPYAALSPLSGRLEAIIAQAADSQRKLRRYRGYYAGFRRSPAFPQSILRYLIVIFQSGGHSYAKTIERVADERRPDLGTLVSKSLGLLLHGHDRIYLWGQAPQIQQSYALTVFYPSYQARLHLLTGLGLSVSDGPGRQAYATRTVLEFLGASINRREAIAACGIYPQDSGEIDRAVRSRLRNEIGQEEGTLCALGY